MPSKYQGIQEQINKERKKRKIGRKVTRDISPSQFINFPGEAMQESSSLFSNAKETVLAYRRQVY